MVVLFLFGRFFDNMISGTGFCEGNPPLFSVEIPFNLGTVPFYF